MSGLFDIKNGLNSLVVARTGLDKSVLFQSIPIIIKDGIVLIILPMLTLMTDQVCVYYYLERKKVILNKLKCLAFLNIPARALMANYIQ